jgi:hypothetical protein
MGREASAWRSVSSNPAPDNQSVAAGGAASTGTAGGTGGDGAAAAASRAWIRTRAAAISLSALSLAVSTRPPSPPPPPTDSAVCVDEEGWPLWATGALAMRTARGLRHVGEVGAGGGGEEIGVVSQGGVLKAPIVQIEQYGVTATDWRAVRCKIVRDGRVRVDLVTDCVDAAYLAKYTLYAPQ